ncbi:MAG: GNAT family N-acetyltransferase [Cytophagales bacterium]|nr:MAG: GNAT family N-acetyltransferase [Cytophagales bacterium]
MHIRRGTQEDIPAIINLLRLSLGESLIPKSEALWKWKHVENPFGPSPILVAEDGGQLIGIRAFLKWEYIYQGKAISACRAVDTAVHPDFQGKGIFTSLTLQLIEEVKSEGIELIFNTPNTKSTPGYLKMGWEKWGNLPIQLHWNWASLFSKNQDAFDSDWDSIPPLIEKLESRPSESSSIKTNLLPGYIFWRYRDCPLFTYHFISDGENYLLIYRIKQNSWGKELRICDFFTVEPKRKDILKKAQKELKAALGSSEARWVSASGLSRDEDLTLISSPNLPIGPLVTLRELGKEINPSSLPWGWSLGDLELF